jgi:hypothetical protein
MFEQALLESYRLLDQAQRRGTCVRFALIGGFAVSARGFARATDDIDYLVDVSNNNCNQLAQEIGGRYFAPDLGDPLDGAFRFDSVTARTSISVQAIRLGPTLTEAALIDVTTVSLDGSLVPVIGLQGLILLKLYAGGPQDILDVAHLLRVNKLNAQESSALSNLCAQFSLQEILETAKSELSSGAPKKSL